MLPPTVPFVCLAVDDFHGRADLYLNRLYSMLRRHCPRPFTLTCFTDRARKVSHPIEMRSCQELMPIPLGETHPTNYKLGLYKQNIMPDKEFIYLDMTLVIRKDMTDFLNYAFTAPQDLVIVDDWNYYSYNSSVMRIRDGALQTIADAFESGVEYPLSVQGDQDFVYEHIAAHNLRDRVAFWPPEQIISFKKTQMLDQTDRQAAARAVQAATIVKFHGKPRMHRFANPFSNLTNLRRTLFFKRELYKNWR